MNTSLALMAASYLPMSRRSVAPAGDAITPPPAADLRNTTLPPSMLGGGTSTTTSTVRVAYEPSGWSTAWYILGAISAALSAYHGTKRNNSVGWGIAWGILGYIAPVLTPAIAFGQGFAQPKKD